LKGKFSSTEAKVVLISRIILVLLIGLLVSVIVSVVMQGNEWLVAGLFPVEALLVCISFGTPGILIIFRRPLLAHAWLQGRNPMLYTDTPWEELSTHKRRFVYLDSMIGLILVVLSIFSFLNA
jgi:hypothetical protein